MIELSYAMADPDFFAPLARSKEPGKVYRPSRLPDGWKVIDRGHWTSVRREGLVTAPLGWKVHVSARLDRAQDVLDTFAGICFGQDVMFKHLSNQLTYLFVHHKHSSRAQSGKFCVAYPDGEAASARLMEQLGQALSGEEGPFILTDRRYPGSRVVHYRYGSYTDRRLMRTDGTSESLVTDGAGRLVEDRRGVSFHLPAGITDPFAGPEPEPAADTGLTRFREYSFETALRHSNGGGAYRAVHRPTGRTVFVKEARDHNGLTWDGRTAPVRLRAEWETLRHVHEKAPGLCPEPVDYFRVWEHEYLVTEYVDGMNLHQWMVANSPLVRPASTPDDFAAYYETCLRMLATIERSLDRLHELGLVFGDVSPGNVLVSQDGRVRLIDFEAVYPVGGPNSRVATDGYAPPPGVVTDPLDVDRYGNAALAQMLICPMHAVIQRNPDALDHIRYDVGERAPLPEALWSRATRFHRPGGESGLPSPEQVAADPQTHLSRLRDRLADALVAMADPEHPDRVFPTSPTGYQTNTLCVAHGTAGVLHALRHAKVAVPDTIADRLRREATAELDRLPPGLHAGAAGIAWVLADLGHLDEARDLLAAAGKHPLVGECATLAGGSAGLAMAHLHLFGRTGDTRHLETAAALAASVPQGDLLMTHLGSDNAAGLLNGRSGIALMWQQFAWVTGDTGHLPRGVSLLHDELALATDPSSPSWSFPVSDTDRRTTPYLGMGTAGVLFTVSRYLSMVDDERLAQVLPALLIPPANIYTVYPGLYPGLAGLGLAMSDHAGRGGGGGSRDVALRIARALFKYAVPHETGARFLGDRMMRVSADLHNGMAGILLFLAHLLDPRPDPLFTVDAVALSS